MKVSARLENLLIRSLSQSMSVHMMEKLAGSVIPDYDLHESTGFPTNIPIPQITAARQITKDMLRGNYLLKFVEKLVDVNKNGVMGNRIGIRFLSQIINETEEHGFKFDPATGIFIEADDRKTKGWGILQQGRIYEFSFLRFDIVENSRLVRKYPAAIIRNAYDDFKNMVKSIVEKRNGRIWNWEGDGGLASFYLGGKNIQATLSGIEILIELFMYNLLRCKIREGIHTRMAVHTGPSIFSENIDSIQNDTLRRLEAIENEHTESDSLTLSPGVFSDLGGKLERFFRQKTISEGNYLYCFKLDWEEL